MGEKQILIAEMLEMQRKFIEHEREHGLDQEEYWLDNEGHPLYNYRKIYTEKANRLVELAHEDKGSSR
ncbi:MAG: hypothetical protein OXG56_09620 [Gammaproteobacteria bacterium]|nr:hypothetical protein [Gammaproteobacteria bacterium]